MINLNLLPDEAKRKLYERDKTARAFVWSLIVALSVIAILIVLLLVNWIYISPRFNASKQQQQTDQAANSNYNNIASQALLINDRLQFITEIKNNDRDFSAILAAVQNGTPDACQIMSLAIDPKANPMGVITGIASNENEALNFKKSLETNKLFRDLAFKDTSSKDGKFLFTLNFDLTPEVNQ